MTNRFSRRLTTFISDSKLSVIGLDDPVMANSNNTWHSSDFQCQSWIDYILVSESFKREINDFEIREDGGFLSDHWPIVMSMSVQVDGSDTMKEREFVGSHLLWKETTMDNLGRYK